MGNPRKEETRAVEEVKRQFFQLRFVEQRSIQGIKALMDNIARETGKDFERSSVHRSPQASMNDWLTCLPL